MLEKAKTYGVIQSVKYLFWEIVSIIWMRILHNSYSQTGEDLLIDDLLGNKKTGFYVDIGAHDPIRFNNTNRFYQRGWRGINIEPNPKCFAKIIGKRPRDINLNIGIGNSDKKMDFFQFVPDTISTFSPTVAQKQKEQGFKLMEKLKIDMRKLADVLEMYCNGVSVDFVSIDTEGYDLLVLESNNWRKFRPKIICIEIAEKDFKGNVIKKQNRISVYLSRIGYKEYINNGFNRLFIDGREQKN